MSDDARVPQERSGQSSEEPQGSQEAYESPTVEDLPADVPARTEPGFGILTGGSLDGGGTN
jgi:hypothetical protein